MFRMPKSIAVSHAESVAVATVLMRLRGRISDTDHAGRLWQPRAVFGTRVSAGRDGIGGGGLVARDIMQRPRLGTRPVV